MRRGQIADNSSLKRSVRLTREGWVRVDQDLRTSGVNTGTDVTGPYWILAVVHVHRGSIRFLRGDEWIEPESNPFAMWVPPFHLIQAELDDLESTHCGVAASQPFDFPTPDEPVLFALDRGGCPETADDLRRLLTEIHAPQSIIRCPEPSSLARRAKAAIDRTFAADCQIAAIVKSLGLSPGALSNHFKAAYGMPPVKYRHWLRVMDAMMKLMAGQAIIDVAQEVGFEDLSRFYKQFRRIAAGSPGRYVSAAQDK